MANKQDSNSTGLRLAFEVTGTPRTLPGSPIWYEREPNNYGDFGGTHKTVARDPINPTRQRSKGAITDLDVPAAFNEDFTQNNMQSVLQSFLYASLREQPDTKGFNTTAVPITGVTASAHTYAAASGLDVFATGHIVRATGFAVAANNGLSVLSGASATLLTLASGLADEASPPAAARVEAVGFQFASGDATLTYSGGVLTFGTTTKDLTTLRLVPGQWAFFGGDSSGLKFATNAPFYARIASVAAHAIVLDKSTITPVTDAGTSKTIQMYFGPVLRNESDPTLIIKRSVELERSLSNDGVGTQSELLTGVFGNDLTINVPQADKLNVDLAFIGMDHVLRTGTDGLLSAGGTVIAALNETAFNTSDDVQRFRMAALDGSLNPTPYFGYVTDGKLTVKNNASPNKAVGVLGGFDMSLGIFEVAGSVTAYFSAVSAISAIKANADVTLDLIVAARNAGFVIDVPLIGLGGGRLTIEKDQAIKVPLETPAYRSTFGHTLCITWFRYLPSAAIA
jgi:Phage tail tube protein